MQDGKGLAGNCQTLANAWQGATFRWSHIPEGP